MANKDGWTSFKDWLGKTSGLWETSDASSERNIIKSLRDQYNNNNRKLQNLIDANTGVKGAKKALQSGMQNASNIAQNASNQATQNARNSGMAMGASAVLGANTGANTFADATQNQQDTMYKAMGDQINGQQKIGENIGEAQKLSQTVLENQQATDEATGNSARSLINTGVSALTGGLGGIATGGGGGILNAIGNASAKNTIKKASNNMATGQGLNLDLAKQGLFQTPMLPGIQASLGGL